MYVCVLCKVYIVCKVEILRDIVMYCHVLSHGELLFCIQYVYVHYHCAHGIVHTELFGFHYIMCYIVCSMCCID